MLRCMAEVRQEDRVSAVEVAVRCEKVATMCGVVELSMKVKQRKLGCFGHVKRRNNVNLVRMVEEMKVDVRRLPGRPSRA